MYSGCTHPDGPCVIRPIPFSKWPAVHFEDGVASKALCYPNKADPASSRIIIGRENWNSQSKQGRIWTYLHELAHAEGAECEACADFRAGEQLQQAGWDRFEPDAEFLQAIAETLEFRSPVEAQRAFAEGYNAHALDAASLPGADVLMYIQGQPTQGRVVEVRKDVWVDPATVDAWDGLFTQAAAEGIAWHVNSSFRDHDAQVYEWNRRHTVSWDDQPDQAAPVDKDNLAALGPAAVPGYSEHQAGLAVDLSFATAAQGDRFADIAEQFHIYRDAPSERWHFAYVDPIRYPNGRRKYPLSGVANVPGNLAAGARTLNDAASGDGTGSEANPTQPYVTDSPSLIYVLISVVLLWWVVRHAK